MMIKNKHIQLIPAVIILGFIFNILILTLYLYFRKVGSIDYLITLLVGGFSLVPALIFFIACFRMIKNGISKSLPFIGLVRDTTITLLVISIVGLITFLYADYVSMSLTTILPMMVLNIWGCTILFAYLNWRHIKPYIRKVKVNTLESDNVDFNPANGAPMIGDSGIDVLGNPYGISDYHSESSNDNNQDYK